MNAAHRLILLALFAVIAVRALGASIRERNPNWDIVMYVAAAKAYEERDAAALHRFTYEALRSSVTPGTYAALLTGDGGYRDAVYSDVTAFQEQLPFYQIRPLYTGAIYLLYKAGVDIGVATHLVSGIAVAAALLILYRLSHSLLGYPLAYAVPFLAIIFGVTDLAQMSTPDGMAFLAFIACSHLYLKQRMRALLAVVPAVVGVRTDLILFALPFLLLLYALHRSYRKAIALSMVTTIAIYAVIGAYWHNAGWSTIFYFTLVQKQAHPLTMPPALTWNHYASALTQGIADLSNDRIGLLYFLLAGYSLFVIRFRMGGRLTPAAALSGVCLTFVAIHFALFPVLWTRWFSGPFLMGAITFLIVMRGSLQMQRPAAQSVGGT